MPSLVPIVRTHRRRIPSLRELQQEADFLESRNRAFGAPEIEQDRPGFLARTIDVLSGFNFAIAGFTDEIAQGNSLGAALARSTRELYSSARSLPFGGFLPEVDAEKEAFGKVLEDAGFGTKTLGDVLPFLEGTIIGSFGSRGALGLTLDIASDPLTYFSFGQSAIARQLLKSGLKRFSRPGNKLFGKELALARKELKESDSLLRFAGDALDEDSILRVGRQVKRGRSLGGASFADDVAEAGAEDILQEVAYQRVIKRFGEDAILDMGGIKWFGRNLVKGKTLKAIYSKFGKPLTDTIRKFEFGDNVLNAAERSYQNGRKIIIGIFSKNERLAGLPQNMRRVMIGMARRFRTGEAKLAERLAIRATGSDWYNHIKDSPLRIRPIFDAIEHNAIDTLDELDRVAAQGMADFFDELGKDAVALGMITEEQFIGNGGRYLAHFWENVPEDFSEIWTRWTGQMDTIANKHNKSRVFNTQREGVRVSQLLELVTAAARKSGIAVKQSPELIPVESIDQIMGKYIQWYASGKSRRLFAEEASDMFGTELAEITSKNLDALFEGMAEHPINVSVGVKIQQFIDNVKTTPLKFARKKPEEMIELDLFTGRPIKRREGVSREIFPTSGSGVPVLRDRVAAAKFARALGAEQRENIRQGLIALDNAPAGKRKGFKPKNAVAGRELANKVRSGGLTDSEWVEAHRIVTDQKGQAISRMGVDELDIAPARQVTDVEAIGVAAVDDDILDIDAAIRRGLSETVSEKGVLNPLNNVERAFLKSLDRTERREYFRQILGEMEGESQIVDFLRKYGDDYIDDLPRLRTIVEGDTEAVLRRFDEVATTRAVDPITGRLEKQSDYVLRGGNSLWGERVKFVPRLIADYIDVADPKIMKSKDWPTLQKALDMIDFTNNWFKLGVYPMFPASGIRDAYSNVWFNSFRIGWHALDPRLAAQSIKVLAHMDNAPGTVRAMSKVMNALGYDPQHIVTKSGRRIRVDEVARQLEARHVTITAEEGLEISEEFARKKSAPRKLVRKVLKEAREPIDNISRVSLAVQNLIDDLSFEDAAHEVGEYLFHYNELPGAAREFITRVVPFGRFTLKNTEFHFNMLRRNPGAVINRLKPFRGREGENQEMVSFRAEGLKIRLGRDGRTLDAVTGIDLPTRNLDFYWRGATAKTLRMALGSLSPFLKAPVELALQKDTFTGTDSPRVRAELLGRMLDTTNAPKGLKDWLGYKKSFDSAGRPRYDVDRWNLGIVFMRSWMFSRVISTSDRQFVQYAKDPSIATRLLDVMTGLRLENINLDEEQRRRWTERIRQLERSSARRGAGRTFNRHFVPRSDREADFR